VVYGNRKYGGGEEEEEEEADAPYLIERAAARCVEADTGSHALPTYQMPPVTNSSRRPTSFQTNPPHSTHSPLLHPRSGRSQIPSPSHTVLSPHPNATRIEAKKKGGHGGHFSSSSHFSSHPSLCLQSFQCHPPIHPSLAQPTDRLTTTAHHTHPLVQHSPPSTDGQSPIGDFSVRHSIPASLGNTPCKALRVRGGYKHGIVIKDDHPQLRELSHPHSISKEREKKGLQSAKHSAGTRAQHIYIHDLAPVSNPHSPCRVMRCHSARTVPVPNIHNRLFRLALEHHLSPPCGVAEISLAVPYSTIRALSANPAAILI